MVYERYDFNIPLVRSGNGPEIRFHSYHTVQK